MRKKVEEKKKEVGGSTTPFLTPSSDVATVDARRVDSATADISRLSVGQLKAVVGEIMDEKLKERGTGGILATPKVPATGTGAKEVGTSAKKRARFSSSPLGVSPVLPEPTVLFEGEAEGEGDEKMEEEVEGSEGEGEVDLSSVPAVQWQQLLTYCCKSDDADCAAESLAIVKELCKLWDVRTQLPTGRARPKVPQAVLVDRLAAKLAQ
jgi:hypothetical protein